LPFFVLATSAMLVARVATAGADPIAWLRAGLGAVSLGVLLGLKRGGLVRAAGYAFAIEIIGGICIFTFVDAPAVLASSPAIARAVANLARHGF